MALRPPGSLRLRITLITTAVVAVVLVASSFLLVGWLRHTQLSDTDRALNEQLDIVQVLALRGSLPDRITPSGLDTGQVQVYGPGGQLLSNTLGLASTVRLNVVPAPPIGQQQGHIVRGADLGLRGDDRYRVLVRTVPYDIGYLQLYAATALRSADAVVRTLALALWISVPILVALAAVATWSLTGRALRPVERMRREVEAIRVAGTDQRLSTDQRAAELDRLAVTLNEMLDRTSASEAIRRQFLADASHELRSPLASARAMLEVGLAYPDRTDWPDTAGEVLVEVDRLEGLAAELLALARAEGGERALKVEPVDLAELVASEVQRSNDPRVSIFSTAPAMTTADRTLLVRAVRNLLDNARRHANHRVTLNVAGGDRVALQVFNDGDEIPPEMRETIFEPFTRLDNARNRDEGGAGLGLSLARRIAEVHHGSLEVVDTTKGAAFVLTLPAAHAEPNATPPEPSAAPPSE
ncbi:MAG: sensor histidine kinase [Ilumatobacteraceae bacterium]